MKTYFFPSRDETYLIYTETPSLPLKNKIDKFCRYSEWNTSLLEEGKRVCDNMYTSYQLHGYIEDGKCYDNQYIFYEQSNEKYQKLKKQNQE